MQGSRHRMLGWAAGITLGTFLLSIVLTSACIGQTSEFYRGKTINLIVGFAPGGSADAYARLIARHIGSHIPGSPTFSVRNMQGASSLNAANYVFNISPKDGTEIGLFAGNIAVDPLISDGLHKFSPDQFLWIGSPTSSVNVCIASPKSSVRSLVDVQEREMVVGTTGTAGNSTYDFPTLLNNVIGTKFSLVKGYGGSAALKLAMDRGEIEGFCGVGFDFLRVSQLTEPNSRILVQLGLSKSPHMPNAPFIMDYAKTDAERKIFALVFSWLNFERPIAAPPGTPADRVEMLRQAFDRATQGEAFLLEARNAMLEIDPMSGEALSQLLKELASTTPAILSRTATLLGRKPRQP